MIKEGSDILGAIASLEGGLWGYPGFDQDSIGAMSLFTPLGPWPECVCLSLSRARAPLPPLPSHRHLTDLAFTAPNPHEQAMSNRIGSLQTKVWAVCFRSQLNFPPTYHHHHHLFSGVYQQASTRPRPHWHAWRAY